MATYKDGRQVNARIVEGLIANQSVEILWWRHNLATGPSFIRELHFGSSREAPLLDESNVVVLSETGKRSGSEHGHWMVYHAASRAQLAKAHPRCEACHGTGVQTLLHFESRTDFVCSCVHGRVYYRAHHRTLREVKLDRYEVVVVTAGRGWGEEQAELIGKFLSAEAAGAEAEKRRREPRFQPGSRYYSGHGPVVAVRVEERELPEWA